MRAAQRAASPPTPRWLPFSVAPALHKVGRGRGLLRVTWKSITRPYGSARRVSLHTPRSLHRLLHPELLHAACSCGCAARVRARCVALTAASCAAAASPETASASPLSTARSSAFAPRARGGADSSAPGLEDKQPIVREVRCGVQLSLCRRARPATRANCRAWLATAGLPGACPAAPQPLRWATAPWPGGAVEDGGPLWLCQAPRATTRHQHARARTVVAKVCS